VPVTVGENSELALEKDLEVGGKELFRIKQVRRADKKIRLSEAKKSRYLISTSRKEEETPPVRSLKTRAACKSTPRKNAQHVLARLRSSN